jgi:hypothetical protein
LPANIFSSLRGPSPRFEAVFLKPNLGSPEKSGVETLKVSSMKARIDILAIENL